jgi:hypothetical protein
MPSISPRNLGTLVGLTVLCLVLAGCSALLPDGSPERPAVLTERTIVVITPEAPRVLPFALRGAHLAAAVEHLEHLVGHGVQLQVDAALVHPDRERFTHALAAAVDNAVLALEDQRRTSPNAFAHGAPLLRVIACRYDTVADHVRSDLDEATGTLGVRLPAPLPAERGAPWAALFEPVVVHHAIDGAYSAWLYARFMGIAAEQVAAEEQGFYADFLTRRNPQRSRK